MRATPLGGVDRPCALLDNRLPLVLLSCLKDAYRIVRVHPHDHHLLGISWRGQVFVDRALPFGLRSAPKIFTAVADSIAWALHQAGIEFHLHYLDDFLILARPGLGAASLHTALSTLAHLGLPVADHKTEGPATQVTFLGILIDSDLFQLRLPAAKLERLQSLVRSWASRRSCTRKELESFLGHLSQAAIVVHPGRTFLCHLFTLMHSRQAPHHFIRLTPPARADIQWWVHFLQSWSGSSFMPLPLPSKHVYSDASGSFGCGAFCQHVGWFQLIWPALWSEVSIAAKEMVPIVLAAVLWGRHWAGQHICFHVDNLAVVAIIRRGTSKDPRLQHLMRCFMFFAALFRFHTTASHVAGRTNVAADALSRNNMSLFLSLVPQTSRTPVPPALIRLLVDSMPDWGSRLWTQQFSHSFAAVLQLQPGHVIAPPTAVTSTSASSIV